MRRLLLVLLPALLAAADGGDSVGDGKTFELPVPKGDEWLPAKPEGDTKALLRTEFADSDPKATAEVRVMTYALSTALAAKGLDAIVRDWAPIMEGTFPEARSLGEGESTLGGEPAWFRDIRTDAARLTWHVSRKNDLVYVFHVIRTNKAVDDRELEEQLAAMRASLRYLEQPKPDGPPKPPPMKETNAPRETLTFDHWRFECVKPEGLVMQEKLDASEMESGVVARFEGKGDQTLIMLRIYAQTASAQRFTLEQLAMQKLERFEKAYDESHRSPPQRDDAWKPALAERAIRLVLTGRRRTVETTRWYLAQCRNDRQYQVEIYVAGGEADRWSKEIKEILDGFRPVKG